MMIGARSAMRRNPAYSSHGTLRSIVVFLLAIGADIGLISGAVHFTSGRSPVVMGVTLAVVILFSCFLLVYVLYQVATPEAAKLASALPPGVQPVLIHRRKVLRWAKVIAVPLAVCAVLALVLPGDSRIVPCIFAGFILFLSAILLPILYWSMRKMDISLTALQADPWVHWVYTAEQWQQWTEVQVERLQSAPPTIVLHQVWTKLAWAMVFIAGGVYWLVPGPVLWKTAYILFIASILIVVPVLSARSARSAPARLRTKLQRAMPEAFFGRDGVFCDGTFTTWLTGDVFLTAASIDERSPRSLLLRFEKDVPNPYGPLQVIPIQQAVLLPAGAEHDLAQLQAQLAARCPKARVTLA